VNKRGRGPWRGCTAQVERDKVRVCTEPVQSLTQVSLQLRAESLTVSRSSAVSEPRSIRLKTLGLWAHSVPTDTPCPTRPVFSKQVFSKARQGGRSNRLAITLATHTAPHRGRQHRAVNTTSPTFAGGGGRERAPRGKRYTRTRVRGEGRDEHGGRCAADGGG
jgi:hypothetical protein